jgi:hypothetical protein
MSTQFLNDKQKLITETLNTFNDELIELLNSPELSYVRTMAYSGTWRDLVKDAINQYINLDHPLPPIKNSRIKELIDILQSQTANP